MANKISCGGFYVDNETLQIDNGVLKVVGGGSGGGGNVFLTNASVQLENGQPTATCDKTFAEINTAYTAGQIMLCNIIVEDLDDGHYGNGLAVLRYMPPNPLAPNESFQARISFCDLSITPNCIANATFGINSAQTFGALSTLILPDLDLNPVSPPTN